MTWQPVTILHRLDHAFEKRERRGCARCGRAKSHLDHYPFPPSFNEWGSGGSRQAYQTQKRLWQEGLMRMMDDAGVPRPMEAVLVEGELCFPRRFGHGPDQGNYRYPLEKALGDALTEGGWLADDDWSRYQFGNLEYKLVRGEAWMALTLFPMPNRFGHAATDPGTLPGMGAVA